MLTEVVPGHIRNTVTQAPEPGIVTTVLRRRPKVTVVTHIVVATTIAGAVTSGKSGETTFVGCSCVWTEPVV